MVRLGWPVLPLIAVWLPLPYLLGALGIPAQPLEVASRLVGQLLWFLAVYLLAVVTTPLLARVPARVLLPFCVAGALAVDVLRFSGFEAGRISERRVRLARRPPDRVPATPRAGSPSPAAAP